MGKDWFSYIDELLSSSVPHTFFHSWTDVLLSLQSTTFIVIPSLNKIGHRSIRIAKNKVFLNFQTNWNKCRGLSLNFVFHFIKFVLRNLAPWRKSAECEFIFGKFGFSDPPQRRFTKCAFIFRCKYGLKVIIDRNSEFTQCHLMNLR